MNKILPFVQLQGNPAVASSKEQLYEQMTSNPALTERNIQKANAYLPDSRPEPSRYRGTQRQFSENICSEDDLKSRIFGTFIVKFLACLPLLGFSNIYKMV